MINGGRLTLLQSLLDDAFTHYGRTSPTVISARSATGDDSEHTGSYQVPLPWPKHEVDVSDALGPAVSERLATGSVLLVPPWVRRRVAPSDGVSRNEHEIALLNCVPNSRDSMLAVLTPASTWTSKQAGPVREKIADHWNPVLVLYAAGVLPELHPSFLLSVAFLRPREAQQSLLRVFLVPAGQDDDSAIAEDFRRLLSRRGGRGKFGYVLRETPLPGDSLAFERHDPALAARRAELSVLGRTATVGELFEFAAAGVHATRDHELLLSEPEQGACRIVTGRDLLREGIIAGPDEHTSWAFVPENRHLKVGDILLPGIFRASDHYGLKAVEIAESDLPAVTNHLVLTLRPKRPLSAPERILILGFLRSPLARQLTAAAGGGQIHLNWGDVREVHLPQPDEALGAALEDLGRAAALFETWRAEAQALLASVFTDDSATGTRTRIVHTGRKIRLRSEAAALLDDVGYAFRTTFPHPVAYRWREVEAAISARSFKAAYDAILAAAEVLLCYTANLGLAMACETGISLGAMKTIRKSLNSDKHGLGFGDWVTVLKEIQEGRAARNAPDGGPIADLRTFLADSGADAAQRRLSERRNDESHLRRTEALDLPAAVDTAMADLSALYQAADFLSDLPLVHVTAIQWDSFQKRATVSYRELTGDHAVVPTRTLTYDEPGIEVGSMYILDAQRRLRLLRPFLAGKVCPRCRNWSTFHIDYRSRGTTVYKSLEHDHSMEDMALDEPLKLLGLL